MRNKELIFNVALDEVEQLGLDKYHTKFLANMVARKVRHPEEKMQVLAKKTMKKMPKLYPKKDLVQVSTEKCLDQLEIALNDSSLVPEDWLSGQTVSHVVKKLASKVVDVLNEN